MFGQSLGEMINKFPLSTASNHFGLQLVNQLSEDKNNVFISPLSLSIALAMLYSGANGTTAQEMRQALGYDSVHLIDQTIKREFKAVVEQIEALNSNETELSVANKMVVQKDLEVSEAFKEGLVTYYKSDIQYADFAREGQKTMDLINEWVSRETHNKIQRLLSEPLDPTTVLVLLNAIYFNGKFKIMFPKSETEEQIFFDSEDNQSLKPMMHREGKFKHALVPELDSQLLAIPYSGDQISLYVLLPNHRQGVAKLKTDLKDFSLLENSIASLTEKRVNVTLPKFKIETQYSLNDKLSQIGIKSAFTPEADLSGIDGKRDLRVSDVMHKAYIEVSEEGTEAAAVTGIVMTRLSLVDLPKEIEFRADHPFMFFIRIDTNRLILFSGIVNKI